MRKFDGINKARLLTVGIMLLAWTAPLLSAEKLPWSPEQATGKPDTPKAGDMRTAWASLAKTREASGSSSNTTSPLKFKPVRIYETYNPGAVSKVTVFTDDGTELPVWEGEEPAKQAPNVFEVEATPSVLGQVGEDLLGYETS